MEVRNNTPSFGMAFVKPKAEDISGFTKLVTKGRRPKLVARGLTQVQKGHAADRYTDIHYLPDAQGFTVMPKANLHADTKVIVQNVLGGTSHPFYPGEKLPTRLSKAQAKYEAEVKELENQKNVSKLKQFCVLAKGIFNMLKESGRVVFFSPKDTLPASLRAASAEATRVEKGVNDELAKIAARAKRQQANEKLIDKALK